MDPWMDGGMGGTRGASVTRSLGQPLPEQEELFHCEPPTALLCSPRLDPTIPSSLTLQRPSRTNLCRFCDLSRKQRPGRFREVQISSAASPGPQFPGQWSWSIP